jgi:Concanavalin A-like lectin/glucanases superfamily/Fibronectin type III domain
MSNRNYDSSTIIKIMKAQNAANYYNRQQTVVQEQTAVPYNTELQQFNPQTGNFDADTIPNIQAGQQAYYFKNYPIVTSIDPQQFTIVIPTPPTAPSAPVITSVIPGNQELFVYFTQASPGSSPITNYLYSVDNGVTFTAFAPPQTTSPLDITGLTNGTIYDVRVQAVNAIGTSTTSNDISGIPSNVLNNPPVLIYYVPGNGSAYIYFTQDATGGSPVSSYQYSLTGGAPYQDVASTGATSPVLITGLTNGTPVSVTLRAVSAIGPSATGSNALTVTAVATVAATSYLEYDPDNASSYSGAGTTVNNVGSYGALAGTTSGLTYITGTGISRKVFNFPGTASIGFGAFNFTSTFTVCAWVRPSYKQSINSLISNGTSGVGSNGFKLNWNDYWDNSYPPGSDRANGAMVFETGNSSTPSNWTVNGTPPNAVTRDVWQHLSYVFDNPNNKGVTFVNGLPVASGLVAIAANTQVSRNYFRIGSYTAVGGTSNGQNMNAQFGYLKVFNTLLNAGQILADYNSSKASFGL